MKYYQKILIGILGISLTLMSEAIVTSAREYQIVQAISSQQVNLRAKQVTVRIDGDSFGSGIIIASADNVHTILTNWHIVKDLGNYVVQTVDGREHQVLTNTTRQLANVDLAILQFTSEQNYQIAEIGDSNNLLEGQNIYFAGYPGELRTESDRVYRFFAANLVGLLTQPNAKGYSLIYDGSAFPGMSGGPVLNDQGQLIGIHGSTNIHAVTGAVSNYAIPSSIYQSAISEAGTSVLASTNDNSNKNRATESTNKPENVSNNDTAIVAETIVEKNSNNNNSATDVTNQPEAVNSNNNSAVTETIVDTNIAQQPTIEIDSAATNSVPVLNSPQNQAENIEVVTSNDLEQVATSEKTKKTIDSTQSTSESTVKTPDEQVNNSANNNTSSSNQRNSNQEIPSSNRQVSLISEQTGIDYTELRNLLAQQKWSEADRQTKKNLSNVFQTIKRKNNSNSIELITLADRACNDIYTIDFLWRKYSGDRFGFSLQKNIWDNLHQNNNFSITVWRSFVTEIGWKEGDINNPAGYILYEQLNFNPQTAPQGHLPWWFDYTNEEKDTMRQILTRCNFQNQVIVNNQE
ncbi:MAG: GUN4 domain-containing protein [Xenococcus sp. (in: cyanobacteria)]